MQDRNGWHALEEDEVLKRLETSQNGLSSAEVEDRLKKYGPNKLQEEKKKSAFVRFMMQFNNVLIYVLLAAALVTALLDHMMDSIVILSVVFINAIIGFIQENRAQNAMDAIKKMLAYNATVFRDGHKQKVNSENLVIGDIVLMEPGNRVLADIRLLQAHGFSAQEAPLTGESVAVDKSPKKVAFGESCKSCFMVPVPTRAWPTMIEPKRARDSLSKGSSSFMPRSLLQRGRGWRRV